MTSRDVMGVAMERLAAVKTSANAARLRAAHDAWLQEPHHRIEYERAESLWTRLDKAVTVLRRAGLVPPEELLREIDEVARQTRRRRRVKRWALNGSVALVSALAACALVIYIMRSLAPEPASDTWIPYVGDYGPPERHVLNDGSELYLNGTSAASVRMTEREREVAVDRGEVLVHVKRESHRPFLVEVGDIVIHAVGTLFSVQRKPTGETEAIVQEGMINIDPQGRSAGPKSSQRARIVVAGQIAVVSGGRVQVEDHDSTEIANNLAWAHGRLYLHGSLAQAIAQFNEHNDRKMAVAEGSSIGGIDVTGLYDCHDLQEFIDSLRPRGVRARIENDTIILFAARDTVSQHRSSRIKPGEQP